MAGLAIGKVVQFGVLDGVPVLLLMVIAWRRKGLLLLLAILVCGLVLGGWRGTTWAGQLARYDSLYDHKVTIVGHAADDAVYGKKTQLSFDVENVSAAGKSFSLPGKIGVAGFGATAIYRGDLVIAYGTLRAGSGGHQGWMSFAQLQVQHVKPSAIDTLRRRFNAGMQSALPEPLASFGLGLLIGQRSNIPKDVYQDLLMVGLVHIIAVSGYNLTILLRASRRLLGKRSSYQVTVFSLGLIGVFLLFTGNSPSIVRASIVSVLSIVAWYYGRNFKPHVLLLLAAALTAWASPLYIWGDISWYLSFLAFTGVLIISPLVRRRFFGKRLGRSIFAEVALESICAEIMTVPLILHVFGQLSLVSLLANVLVVALVPLAMLLALIAGIAGMVMPAVAGWLAWPASFLLTYMLDIAHVLARIPHVFVEHRSLSFVGMLGLYGVVSFTVVILRMKSKQKNAIITDNDKEKEGTASNERTLQMVNN
jgi:ComEC/Rec2-related protein